MEAFPELPGIWGLTPWGALLGLIVLFLISIQRGWIITKSSHERELKLVQERAEDWKEAAKSTEETIAIVRAQNSKLIEANEAATAFFKAVTPNRFPIEDTLDRLSKNGK